MCLIKRGTMASEAEESRRLEYLERFLQNTLLCFDRLSMNGRDYNDFKLVTVRPEPVEGQLLRAHRIWRP